MIEKPPKRVRDISYIIFLETFELFSGEEIKLVKFKNGEYQLTAYPGNATVSNALKLYHRGALIKVKEVNSFYVEMSIKLFFINFTIHDEKRILCESEAVPTPCGVEKKDLLNFLKSKSDFFGRKK